MIVLESHPRWTPVLRRIATPEGLIVREARSWEDATSWLAGRNDVLVVAFNAQDALEQAEAVLPLAQDSVVFIVGGAELESLRTALMGLGAAAVVTSLRQASDIVKTAAKYESREGKASPKSTNRLLEKHWESLPFGQNE